MSRKNNIKLWLCLLCLLPVQIVAQTLEYWFDDHYDQRATTTIATSEEVQEIRLDLRDNTKFPFGYHKLNMRVMVSGKPSAVYSSGVLKLSAGKATKLEYWVDDEYISDKGQVKSKTISGSATGDGSTYQFVEDLDLSDVTPGSHRLYYRTVSNSGRTTSAVSMTPVMVKSRYNVDNPETVTVTEQVYWFDDEEPEIITVADPKNIINQPRTFDARKLSEGQHTLHMKFGNSLGLRNGRVSTTFIKTKEDPPVIEAQASVENGVVTLKFNSVPYGQVYTVVRQYPSGSIRMVEDFRDAGHPVALKATDKPAPGTYTYYVVGKYYDADGKIQEVRSEDVSVTVDKAASDVKRGTIHGVIKLDGERVYGNSFSEYKVLINGENARNAEYFFKKESGKFVVGDVPYGTEITIGIDDKNYSFKDVKLIVSENTIHNTYTFNGTKKDGVLPEDAINDLLMIEKIHILPDAFEVKVKNLSSKPWSGNIRVMVLRKKLKDFYDSADELPISYYYTHWKAGYEDAPTYRTVVDQPVHLEGNEIKVLELEIIDMPNSDEKEDYYACVYSKKDGVGQMKELAGYANPQTLNFNPFEFSLAIEKGFASYMSAYAEVMRIIKEYSLWGDPFKLAIESIEKNFELWVKNFEKKDNIEELIKDETIVALRSAGLLLNLVEDMDKAVNKYVKTLKSNHAYEVQGEISKLYKTIKDVYNASQADDNHKFFELAKLVLKYSPKEYDPVLSIYKTYFEVGAKMADAVQKLENYNNNRFVWERFVSKNAVFKIKVRRYAEDRFAGYFPGKEIYSQIESINIALSTPQKEGEALLSVIIDNPLFDEDGYGITIKNVDFKGYNTLYDTSEAWMTITWKNKRVTHVPLLDKDFVKLQNFNANSKEPLIMTVELQSETYMNTEKIANKLTFVKP